MPSSARSFRFRRCGLVAVLLGALVSAAVAPVASGAVPTRVLPDLAPQPPHRLIGPTTTFSYGLGVDAPFIVAGCYPEERVRKGAGRCLRFDTIVGNVGEGAFELAYDLRKGHGVSAVQRIFNSDGSYADRYAVTTEFHPTHVHFHVQDFYVARLWAAAPDGTRLREKPVARGDKNGFCPEDTEPVGTPPEAPPNGDGNYRCFEPSEDDGTRGFQVVGVSAGWQDVYGAALPDQFVEITGVPDGQYVLEIELDPHDVFVEANETNNVVCVHLALAGTEAEILKPNVPC